ncbi:ATP-dependent RecD-like DNA helicase [candidate division KSB1 bacterium]
MTETQIQGNVLRLTFRNEETGYTIAKVKCDDLESGETAVIGTFPSIDVGEFGLFKGEWIIDPQYGRQFAARSFDFVLPSTAAGIERLLSKGKFRGIGKKYARDIVKKFGIETVEVIEKSPHLLMEIPGIGKERVAEIKKSWNRKKALKNINIFLAEKEIPLHFSEKIFAKYRENSLTVLRNNPYQLIYDIAGIGFRTADRIALDIGIQPHSKERIQAAILYLLQDASDEGHTYLPRQELTDMCAEFLQVDHHNIEEHISVLQASNRIFAEQDRIYLRYLYGYEQQIVKRMLDILSQTVENRGEDLEGTIGAIEKKSGITYTERQKEALRAAVAEKALLITGGPGTGKTTLILGIIALFHKEKLKVRLAAPTGRAAKRMEETCGTPSQTIHRLLEYNPQERKFIRNISYPVDADVVIIDETSMIDTPLMAGLICGIDVKARVIFVGDADQLPSVGPGNVFKDIISSDRIPVIRLDTVFRQDETSTIVSAAHDVNGGLVPKVDNNDGDSLFFMVEADTEVIPKKLIDLVCRRLPEKYGLDPLKDIQVITPMYKGSTGANNLNAMLQETLNRSDQKIVRGTREFRTGDKVMQTRNNYSKEVYNGDIGLIKDIDLEKEEVSVQFEGKVVLYEFRYLDELVHAYAVTVHKSQGSEYPAVIMPLTTQHYIMLQKNLVYTALTRAKQLMVFIGTYKAFHIAVKNDKPARRYTFLAERLRNPEKYASQLDLLNPIEENI